MKKKKSNSAGIDELLRKYTFQYSIHDSKIGGDGSKELSVTLLKDPNNKLRVMFVRHLLSEEEMKKRLNARVCMREGFSNTGDDVRLFMVVTKQEEAKKLRASLLSLLAFHKKEMTSNEQSI